MRLATWNIRHGWCPGTGRPDPEALGRACAGLDVDVLALQEVDRRTARVGGVDLLEVAAAATGSVPVDGAVVELQGGTYGNALLVRGEPLQVSALALPGAAGQEPRGALRASVAGLVVATCHLGFHAGEGQAQLDAVLAWLDAESGPAVLLGDLNLTAPRLQPGWRAVDVSPAFPADAPDRVIDHVLARGVAVAAVPDAGRPAVSDHRPVVVELDR